MIPLNISSDVLEIIYRQKSWIKTKLHVILVLSNNKNDYTPNISVLIY